MRKWNYHYLTSLGIAVINVLVLCLVFRFRHEDVLLCKQMALEDARTASQPGQGSILAEEQDKEETTTESRIQANQLETGSDVAQETPAAKSSGLKLRTILMSPLVQLLAWFCLLYVSAEITIGSWIVPYVQTTLNGPPNTGMISSGYFAGLTIGRIIFIPVNRWIGERKAIYVYTLVAVALEFVSVRVLSVRPLALTTPCTGHLAGSLYHWHRSRCLVRRHVPRPYIPPHHAPVHPCSAGRAVQWCYRLHCEVCPPCEAVKAIRSRPIPVSDKQAAPSSHLPPAQPRNSMVSGSCNR